MRGGGCQGEGGWQRMKGKLLGQISKDRRRMKRINESGLRRQKCGATVLFWLIRLKWMGERSKRQYGAHTSTYTQPCLTCNTSWCHGRADTPSHVVCSRRKCCHLYFWITTLPVTFVNEHLDVRACAHSCARVCRMKKWWLWRWNQLRNSEAMTKTITFVHMMAEETSSLQPSCHLLALSSPTTPSAFPVEWDEREVNKDGLPCHGGEFLHFHI